MYFYQDQSSQNNQPTANDQPQQIDMDPGMIIEKLDSWVDGFIRLLPNIGVAIVVIIIFYFLGRFVRNIIEQRYSSRGRNNLGTMLGGLIKYVVIAIGVMLGITLVFPSVKPSDMIAGLGVSSVAIGFAFKDILQNWLAGLLILLRQPFEIRDQIVIGGFEGTVEKIETRATIIRTYAGEQIVIPNNEIYTTPIKVNTAYDLRRSEYDVGIGYADDIDEAVRVIQESVSKVEGVSSKKEVETLPWDLAASWVTIRVRWWTTSTRVEVVKTMVKVIHAIKHALDEAGIDMPFETQVHLFHDQTEDRDGDRSQQREGWPDDGEGTTPKWKAEKEKTTSNDNSG